MTSAVAMDLCCYWDLHCLAVPARAAPSLTPWWGGSYYLSCSHHRLLIFPFALFYIAWQLFKNSTKHILEAQEYNNGIDVRLPVQPLVVVTS